MDDPSFKALFEPIMEEIVRRYRPEAVVLQSGADSLSGDRLGRFNLTTKGHAACHEFMAKFGLPLLVLGGGGYKIKNVARCWAYETAVLLGEAPRCFLLSSVFSLLLTATTTNPQPITSPTSTHNTGHI